MDLAIDFRALQQTRHLPDHHRVLNTVFEFFGTLPGIEGAFVSGSTATGGMDEYSDLDLGFLVSDEATREKIWRSRWDWQIAPCFHRFDADHIKPYFVIYFFDPSIHTDLNFYVRDQLPTRAGAPFTVAWDHTGVLEPWAKEMNQIMPASIDWSGVVHDDDRFWAWMHYCASHALRGELYDAAFFIKDLRRIVEDWEAKLNGFNRFDTRRVESRLSAQFLSEMAKTFCRPIREEIGEAFRVLTANQLRQRKQIAERTGAKWATTERGIQVISDMITTV